MAKREQRLNPFIRFLTITLTVVVAVVVYAFAFERTDIDLGPIKDEQRRPQLIRILRGLARPDIITHEETVTFHVVEVMTPCPSGGFVPPPPDTAAPHIEMFPTCALPNSEVTVRGFNFDPGEEGPLSFVPGSGVTLNTRTATAGADGTFSITFTIPDRPSTEVQGLRFTTRERIGSWMWSETARDSWRLIIETLMLALVATTLGTAAAIPLSFFSARNLMRTIRSPLASVALFVIGLPVGIFLGRLVGRWVTDTGEGVGESIPILLGGALAIVLALLWLMRVTVPAEDESPPTPWEKAGRWGVGAIVALGGLFAIGFAGRALLEIGLELEDALGPLEFLGGFIRVLGDVLTTFLTVIAAIVTGMALAFLGARAGHLVKQKLSPFTANIARFVLGGVAVATLAVMIGGAVEWLYQLAETSNARATTVGAALLSWPEWWWGIRSLVDPRELGCARNLRSAPHRHHRHPRRTVRRNRTRDAGRCRCRSVRGKRHAVGASTPRCRARRRWCVLRPRMGPAAVRHGGLLRGEDRLQRHPVGRTPDHGNCFRRVGGARTVRRGDRAGAAHDGIAGQALLRTGGEHHAGADRGGDRHRCDATTEHHLRGRPSNRSAVHRLHALPVGHQRPHVHDHRVRWRWWHRVPPPAEHQSAPLPLRRYRCWQSPSSSERSTSCPPGSANGSCENPGVRSPYPEPGGAVGTGATRTRSGALDAEPGSADPRGTGFASDGL